MSESFSRDKFAYQTPAVKLPLIVVKDEKIYSYCKDLENNLKEEQWCTPPLGKMHSKGFKVQMSGIIVYPFRADGFKVMFLPSLFSLKHFST